MAIPWNETLAAHLYRRAAFGGTKAEIHHAVGEGLEASVDRLLNYASVPDDLLDSRINALNFYLKSDGKLSDLVRWWLMRLIFTARPLQERMTLFWHNHFATAYSKVLNLAWMKSENETIRAHALGTFRDLMLAVSQDAAMMYWLDSWLNTKTNPNENFGRELLELFTLGVGNYAESDVQAAMRAFSGWSYDGTTTAFLFNQSDHDYGVKTFLGNTGTWNGNDIIDMACATSAHGQRIASRLFAYFAYDNPEQDVIDRFARIYLDSATDLRVLVRAILTSPEMYSDKALWAKVKSPLDHVVIASRQLLLAEDVENTFDFLTRSGQTPFDPPDVSGWKGGTAWVTPTAILNLMNFADIVATQFDPILFTAGEMIQTPAELVDFFLGCLGPLVLAAEVRNQLLTYVSPDGPLPSGDAWTSKQRGLVRMILSLPEWQMY